MLARTRKRSSIFEAMVDHACRLETTATTLLCARDRCASAFGVAHAAFGTQTAWEMYEGTLGGMQRQN